MAVPWLFMLRLLSVILAVAPEYSLAVKNIRTYRKYYIEDFCTNNESTTYILSRLGIDSVADISAFHHKQFQYGAKTCTITIKPPFGYSVNLELQTFNFGAFLLHNSSLDCSSYIQVSNDNRMSDKLCGLRSRLPSTSFTTYGRMTILFSTASDYFVADQGFTLIATAYHTPPCGGYGNFHCDNERCIWNGLTCDSINNCGDSSDERDFGNSKCFDFGQFTAKPNIGLFTTRPFLNPNDFNWEINNPSIDVQSFHSTSNISFGAAVSAAVCVILGAFIRFYCYYQCNEGRRREIIRAVTIIRARSVLQQPSVNNPAAPPPPYETLVNETEDRPESPPEYAALTVPRDVPCDPQNSAAQDPPSAAASPDVSREPPPPYEP